MACFLYFEDDRVINLDMSDDCRHLLFNHPQELSSLAKMIFKKRVIFNHETVLPTVEFKSGEYTNNKRFFEGEQPVDFFSYGLFMFISDKLKSIFDDFHVEAFYSKTRVTLDESNIFLITIEPQPVLITELASLVCECNLSITDPPSFPNQIFG